MAKMISRTEAKELIPEEVTRDIINGVRQKSVAFSLMRKLPNMTSNIASQPVLSMLPIADFVNGDSGMKVTTNQAWDKKIITAGEIAAIIPVPQAVIDDANYDIWGETRPTLEEAFARVADVAILAARNPKAPADWPEPIIVQAINAGNTIEIGTGLDLAEDFSNMFGILEEDGYDVSGIAAQRSIKTKLRNLRANTGEPLYTPLTGTNPATVYGVPTHFVGSGVFPATTALALAGDWNNAVFSIRQDMTFEIFNTGVISDDDGKVVYNLLQQDMVAMRAVMRFGWQIANPIDIDRQEADKTYFPFSILKPKV